LSHDVILHFDEVHEFIIEAHFIWFIELRGCRQPAVAAVSHLAIAGDRRELTCF